MNHSPHDEPYDFHPYEPYDLRVRLGENRLILSDPWGEVFVEPNSLCSRSYPHPKTLDLANKIHSDFATWYEYYEAETHAANRTPVG